MRVKLSFLIVISCGFCALAAPAVECWMQVGEGDTSIWTPTLTGNSGDTYTFSEPDIVMPMWELTQADFTVDPDPFINSTVAITNPTSMMQTYTFTVMLPISPALPGATLHGGSTAATLNDSNFDGTASLMMSGQGMYMGMIDGGGVLQLLPPTVGSLSVNTSGGIATASASAGLPGPTLASGPAMMNIAIQHKFQLSPGDSATFNSNFIVTPEPMTICLLGLGGLLIRRRK